MISTSTSKDVEARRDRAVGSLLGLAVGDALGTTLEFSGRDTRPLHDQISGGGPFRLDAGHWTDDTSMALCLAEAINENGLDPVELMNRFCNWMRHGHNSTLGVCFDIGMTTRQALNWFLKYGDPFAGSTGEYSAGNGGIMRLAPVAIANWNDPDKAKEMAVTQSRTTHASPQCLEAADVMARMLVNLMNGREWAIATNYDPTHFSAPPHRDSEVAPIGWTGWQHL